MSHSHILSWNSKLDRIIACYSTDQYRADFQAQFSLWLKKLHTESLKLVTHVMSQFRAYLEYPETIVPSSTECKLMVKKNSALVSRMIQEVCEINGDSVVEFLKRLQTLTVPDSPIVDDQWQDLYDAAKRGWNADYRGDYAFQLKTAIQHGITSPQTGYSHIGTILQSSGTGKSRLVDELAKTVFTIPFNVRQSTDRSAYPPPDISVRNFFTPTWGRDKTLICNLVLLKCVFEEVNNVLDQQKWAAKSLARDWRLWLAAVKEGDRITNREFLYNKIVKKANTEIPTIEDNESRLRPELIHKARAAALALIRNLDRPTTEFCLFIYFDEAHVLAEKQVEDSWLNQWDVLCSAIADIAGTDTDITALQPNIAGEELANNRPLPLFCMSLSTNGSFKHLGGPKAAQKSSRAISAFSSLWPPYCSTPFDVWHTTPVMRSECTLKTISNYGYLAKFGRPLWQTSSSARCTALMSLARMKLTLDESLGVDGPVHTGHDYDYCGSPDAAPYLKSRLISDKGFDLTIVQHLAILGMRLLLDFGTRKDLAKVLESELVSGYMRYAFSVPEHREYLYTGCPSEPVLAEAAAVCLYEMNFSPVACLEYLMKEGLISKGDRGEMVARLLWLLAFDRAVHQTFKNRTLSGTYLSGHLAYCQPMRLIDVLSQLVGPSHIETILQARPDNVRNGPSFQDAFEHAYVNYSHFGRMGDNSVTTSTAVAAFLRSMAMQCSFTHPTIDIALPLLIFNATDIALHGDVQSVPLDKAVPSGALVSVKATHKPQRQNYTIDADKLKFWGKASQKETPYVTILMELGVPTASPSDIPTSEATASTLWANVPPTRSSTRRRVPVPKTKKHPRYSFVFKGCSESMYNVIHPDSDRSYHYILDVGGLYGEHPRIDQRGMRECLERQKPDWRLTASTYEWIKEPGLPEKEQVEVLVAPRQEEGITVGSYNEDDFETGEDESMDIDERVGEMDVDH